jgi:hypothetical protein
LLNVASSADRQIWASSFSRAAASPGGRDVPESVCRPLAVKPGGVRNSAKRARAAGTFGGTSLRWTMIPSNSRLAETASLDAEAVETRARLRFRAISMGLGGCSGLVWG